MLPETRRYALITFLWLASASSWAVGAGQQGFAELLATLPAGNFEAKAATIADLESLGDPRTPAVLRALLEGGLYYRKNDNLVVFAERVEAGYSLRDVLTGAELGAAGRRAVRKIGVNNRLCTALRGVLARLDLADPEPGQRVAAVKQMLGSFDPENVALLHEALVREQDPEVLAALNTVIALAELESDDKSTVLIAIRRLDGALEPEVRNRLQTLTAQDEAGDYLESDKELRNAANQVLSGIEQSIWLSGMAETVFFGVSLGSVLVLAALGLAITFGVMGVINMAHGELIMLGAYTTYVVQQAMPESIGVSILVAIPLAFIVSGLVGVAIERGVIRFLYGRPLETLLATFGISLFLQQLVRTVFSSLNRSVAKPLWMSGSIEINSVLSLTLNRLYIVGFTLSVFALLLYVMKHTSIGLQVRAVSQNRAMAQAMGIRSNRVDAMTFGLGAGIAGVALSQLTNVGPNLGQAYIIDSFMVVVFGGVGNLWGTLIGGLSLGIANKILEPYWGAVLAKILILVFIILFIQKRPRGLFPQQGRAAQ